MKERIFSYVVACTFRKNCEDCPFIKYREMNLKEAWREIKNLTYEELLELYKLHIECKK